MRMNRLIYILLTLEKEKKVTAKRLAEELETSIRTIYRDIDTLCEAGIPICTESGQGGGISLMEGYATQIKHFDKEDIIYLYLNGIGVKAERSALLDKHTDLSLKKIMRTLPDTQAEEIEGIVSRFVVDHSPWWGEEQTFPQIDAILQAVFGLHKVRITYKKVNKEASSRVIRPYGIVIKDSIWYVVGYCESSMEIRTFRCDRITSCVLLEETFVYPKGFELKKHFDMVQHGFKEKCALNEQYPVTLTVPEQAFCYLKGLEFTVLHQEENLWTICVNLYSYENAQNDFWNLLMLARTIEPKELKEAVCRRLKEYLNDMNS